MQDLDPEATATNILAAITAASFLPCLISAILTMQSGRTTGLVQVVHRFNMELDLQRLFGLRCAQLYELAGTPHLGSYTRTLLVSQGGRTSRDLFVSHWDCLTRKKSKISCQNG
jgi:hypothetical protein